MKEDLRDKQPPGYIFVIFTDSVPALDYNYLVDIIISSQIDSVSLRSIQPLFWWGNHLRDNGSIKGCPKWLRSRVQNSFIPRPRRNLVTRPRFIDRLNAGQDKKLTLISAPAGFEKITFR